MLKDFNIVKEAGGVGKAVIKKFNAIVNSSGSLEIRLQWAGKGTTGIPFGSVYGPLISAISVDPGQFYSSEVIFLLVAPSSNVIYANVLCHHQADFTPPMETRGQENKGGKHVRSIVSIVLPGALVIIMGFGIAWWRGCLGQKVSLERGKKYEANITIIIIEFFG